tara:strand:+ start:402 stop:905 length:504 start_codon:yes stop_codon:yes gene_type:complete
MNENSDQDAKKFLILLQERVAELLTLSLAPKNWPDEINFEDYQKFRKMMGECLSFLIIIERRIEQSESSKKEELSEQFDELTTAIWSILLDGSLGFLNVISKIDFLPIGTKHVFVQELKTLYDAEKVLKQEKFEKYLKKDVLSHRHKAEQILEQIIDRAPQLLQLEI